MTTDTLIETRLSILSPDYRAFVESDFIEMMAISFGEVHSFNSNQLSVLENAITLYLLFIFSKEETIKFISDSCKIPLPDAQGLFAAVELTLPAEVRPLITESYRLIQGNKEPNPLANEIAETEQVFASLQGIRTMAGDIHSIKDDVPVHTSSQAELLNRNLAPETPPNRWDTDR
jgi:hypothetical protein